MAGWRETMSGWLDRVGASASLLCALHCALLPVAVAVVPGAAAGWWAGRSFEVGFVVFALSLVLATVALSYPRHRIATPLWFLVPGALLLLLGTFSEWHEREPLHTVLVSVGGTLVAVGHLVNLRLAHGHVHDAHCGHCTPPARR